MNGLDKRSGSWPMRLGLSQHPEANCTCRASQEWSEILRIRRRQSKDFKPPPNPNGNFHQSLNPKSPNPKSLNFTP